MKKLLLFAGAICGIYGVIILGILGMMGLFNYFYAVVGLLLLLLGFFWDKISEKLRKVIVIFITTVLLVFCTVEGIIISKVFQQPKGSVDYVIILGARVRRDGPSVDFKARIDSALVYLNENPDSMVITTGGQGMDEVIAEGQCAHDYLVEHGISEDRILIEDKSTNTRENLLFAKRNIEARGDKIEECTVCIASASYHLRRASFIAEKNGYENVSVLPSNGLWILIPHYYTREFFALINDFILLSF